MKIIKYVLILNGLFLCIPTTVANTNNACYMDWNRDHTRTHVKPVLSLSEEDASKMNCYRVTFDKDGNFISAKYFSSGQPSHYSNYGAHQIVRSYHDGYYQDSFKDRDGNTVNNANGVSNYKYSTNADGFWYLQENLDDKGKLIDEYGYAKSKVYRDHLNRVAAQVNYNTKEEIVPDVNDFKVVHFTYNKDGYLTARINKNSDGNLQLGKYGYAKVAFFFDQNGTFYGEEFLDAHGKLTTSSGLNYAKIDFRDFNQYGKNQKMYFTDKNGYPNEDKAMATISYHPNMTRDEVLYFDRIGNPTEDYKGVAKRKYRYDADGKYLRQDRYDLDGNIVK